MVPRNSWGCLRVMSLHATIGMIGRASLCSCFVVNVRITSWTFVLFRKCSSVFVLKTRGTLSCRPGSCLDTMRARGVCNCFLSRCASHCAVMRNRFTPWFPSNDRTGKYVTKITFLLRSGLFLCWCFHRRTFALVNRSRSHLNAHVTFERVARYLCTSADRRNWLEKDKMEIAFAKDALVPLTTHLAIVLVHRVFVRAFFLRNLCIKDKLPDIRVERLPVSWWSYTKRSHVTPHKNPRR